MVMWKRITIFYEEIYADRFEIIQGGWKKGLITFQKGIGYNSKI